jgi:hypothetical protein
MAPHALLGMAMIATSNVHLMLLPVSTAFIHYCYRYNHFTKITMYYDMQTLGKSENYVATFDKIREMLLTDERFNILIEQRDKFKQGDPNRETTLIFENPVFLPYAYKIEGMVGKLDADKTRYSFECSFRDLVKESQGEVKSLIIFNKRGEAYFESLRVEFSQPKQVEFRITES